MEHKKMGRNTSGLQPKIVKLTRNQRTALLLEVINIKNSLFKKDSKYKSLLVLGIFGAGFIAQFFTDIPVLFYAIGLDILLLFANIPFRKKTRQAVRLLNKAMKSLYDLDFIAFIEYLYKAQLIVPTVQLQKFIEKVISKYGIEDKRLNIIKEAVEYQSILEQTEDQNIAKIISEIIKVLNYIFEHYNSYYMIKFHLEKAKKELDNPPPGYQNHAKQLLERYQNLLQLEDLKIEIYNQTKEKLITIYHQLLFISKLEKEKQELYEIENKLFESTIVDKYELSEKADLLNYYNTYIETVAKLTDEINRSQDSSIINQLKQDLATKLATIEKATAR